MSHQAADPGHTWERLGILPEELEEASEEREARASLLRLLRHRRDERKKLLIKEEAKFLRRFRCHLVC